VQGNTRHDRRKKPEGLRAEASGSAERWPSEVDYGLIYRDCEVVMNGRNIVTFWIRECRLFCHAQYSQEDATETHAMRRREQLLLCTDFSWWINYASCYVVFRVFTKDELKALPTSMRENSAMMSFGR
jgi:hypothetical protein